MLRDDDLALDKFLIETDAPFMLQFVDKANFDDDISEALSEDAKEFARGCSKGTNEPATMPLVCELIAAFMSKSPEVVAHQGTINIHKFFRIPMNDSDKSFLGAMRNGPDRRKMPRGLGGMDWTVTDEQEKYQMVTRLQTKHGQWKIQNDCTIKAICYRPCAIRGTYK